MASTSSIGAQTLASASTAQEFYSSFNLTLQDLESKIENADKISDLEPLVQELSKARNRLTEITPQLPTYDRQIHEQHFKRVSALLSTKRTVLKPSKAAFSFKRTKAPTQSPNLGSSKISKEVTESNPSTLQNTSLSDVTSFHSLTDKSQELLTIESLSFPEKDGKTDPEAGDLHLRNLDGCLVDLRSSCPTEAKPQGQASEIGAKAEGLKFKALQIRNLKSCLVLAGEVEGSVMIHGCEDSVFILACRQFRMHNSGSTLVFLKTSSLATIEDCSRISFSHAPNSILQSSRTDEASLPDQDSDPSLQVQDFNHISDFSLSPNWKLLDTEKRTSCLELLKNEESRRNEKKGWSGEIVQDLLRLATASD